MNAARTVLIAAGGTGGHLFPAAAFAEEMRARGWRTALMTDSRGRTYAANFPADSIEDVPAATFSGANPLKAIGAAAKIARGVTAARARLKVLKPAIVAGFGGYPSLPALWAARGLGVPILIHEQNAVLGRVNRFFAGAATVIACGFDRLDLLPAGAAARKVVVGNPVRAPIRAVRDAPFPDIAPGSALRILVIGGSQGARILGDVVPAAVGLLPDEVRMRVTVEQQVREEQVDAVRRVYAGLGITADIAPFFTDMADRYARAHLVIARAGASSATEIAVVGRPAIFVPLAIAADDHQTANAEALTAVSAADAIPEAAFSPDALAGLLALRLSDPHDLAVRGAAARAAGKPDAAKRLADIAEQAAWPAH
jgi:UDP-N-acetylglucosamine--N-acetylmuramyl-(pentapeptide) pyrophosphoryl-undecaprenol N-acetylglucosamine transferase